MPSGGRRQGAGAPRNNTNHLKNGRYSRQVGKALFDADPEVWKKFLARMKDEKLRDRVTVAASLVWARNSLHNIYARRAIKIPLQ